MLVGSANPDLVLKAKSLHNEIKDFLSQPRSSVSSLPRVSGTVSLAIPYDPTSQLGDDDRDNLSMYLCSKFPQLRDLGNKDVSSMVHNTICFIIDAPTLKGIHFCFCIQCD